MDRLTRRAVLGTLATAIPPLAGCVGESGEETDNPSASPTSTTTLTSTMASPALTATRSTTARPTTEPSATVNPTETTPSEDELVETARRFVDELATGAFETAWKRFAPSLRGRFPIPRLHRSWLGVTAQHGDFESISSAEYGTNDGSPFVVLTLRCAEGTQAARITFDVEARITGLHFPSEYSPPAYADTDAFGERTVEFGTEMEGCSLPATVSIPVDAAPVPGVVLVHGSGPHDRDETIGPNKVFKDIAWGLASRGIAVLRFEKRTQVCEVSLADWTLDNVAVEDALGALSRLREFDAVGESTFVVGHSLGATAVPRIAERDGHLSGGVMLAAYARRITDIVRTQVRHLLSVDGTLSNADERRLETVKQQIDRIESGDVSPGETVLNLPGAWWRSLLEYDQIATATRVDTPLFVAQGGRDYQVTMADFERWQRGLSSRKNVTFRSYPELNHLFQPGAEPSLPQEYGLHDNVARRVIGDVSSWVSSYSNTVG